MVGNVLISDEVASQDRSEGSKEVEGIFCDTYFVWKCFIPYGEASHNCMVLIVQISQLF